MIKYPFLPQGKHIEYVRSNNVFMKSAKHEALHFSLDDKVQTGAVVVADNKIIGQGSNGSPYHSKYGCRRVELNIPTGEGYELCEGCHPKNHAEVSAINNAVKHGHSDKLAKSSMYLWGHWWCCEYCWDTMIKAGIQHVYLLQGSEIKFNRESRQSIYS